MPATPQRRRLFIDAAAAKCHKALDHQKSTIDNMFLEEKGYLMIETSKFISREDRLELGYYRAVRVARIKHTCELWREIIGFLAQALLDLELKLARTIRVGSVKNEVEPDSSSAH